jgi:hypothetical protein
MPSPGTFSKIKYLLTLLALLDEEGAKEKLYSYVQAVNVKDAKGLQTALVEDA